MFSGKHVRLNCKSVGKCCQLMFDLLTILEPHRCHYHCHHILRSNMRGALESFINKPQNRTKIAQKTKKSTLHFNQNRKPQAKLLKLVFQNRNRFNSLITVRGGSKLKSALQGQFVKCEWHRRTVNEADTHKVKVKVHVIYSLESTLPGSRRYAHFTPLFPSVLRFQGI